MCIPSFLHLQCLGPVTARSCLDYWKQNQNQNQKLNQISITSSFYWFYQFVFLFPWWLCHSDSVLKLPLLFPNAIQTGPKRIWRRMKLIYHFVIRYQFVPQMIFLNSLFGYLSLLIVIKWCTGSQADLYHVMIYMFLSPTDDLGDNQLFWGQRPLQACFLLL